MIHHITLTVSPGEETDSDLVRSRIAEMLRCTSPEITHIVFNKKSIDARHGRQKIRLQLTVYVNEEPGGQVGREQFAEQTVGLRWRRIQAERSDTKQVVIVGCGPAGLFAAFRLLESGIRPVIIERGKRTGDRKRDIAAIGRGGEVNEHSNYCFGEGGAGTFSDGKLYTRSAKRGNIRGVLETLRYFGADEAILTDSHPHIGSDKLPSIICAITDKIIELGGEVRFETLCEDFMLESGGARKKLCGVRLKNLASGERTELKCNALILAAGHSALDIYRRLNTIAPDALEAKTFAAGVRVEHPREIIDAIQYHGAHSSLPAAEYRLTAQIDGRGVYSFCMCPGGLIVPSASAPGEIVVNGMSPSGRNSRWSNAAIVVEIRPEDTATDAVSENRFAGLAFREAIEKTAFAQSRAGEAGLSAQAAPAQRLIDFLAGRESKNLPETSYTPGVVSSRLDLWLPKHISRRLQK
jgi:uncharacterized FAD-dependent dehydrogenase